MRRMCALLLCPYLSFAAAQLNLTALPGAFPYSYAALDEAGNIYLAGSTNSAIPLVNPIQSTVSTGNCSDEAANSLNPCPTAFVAKLDPTGSKILYSTYLGATQQYAASCLLYTSHRSLAVAAHYGLLFQPGENEPRAQASGASMRAPLAWAS